MLELFARRRDFRQLFLAHAVSRAGDAFNAVALVVLVLELTDSSLGVAGAVAFEVVAVLLFGVVAGLFVDRYPRREVMVIADLTRAVLVGALAVFSGSLVLAFVVAFGVSLGGVVFNPAAASLVPETVTRNELVRANATLWATGVTLQIAMAPLAGVLIATVGVGAAFAVNAASFAGSAILLVGLRAGRTPASMEPVGWRAALAGVHEVRAHPLLRRLSVAQLLAALSAGATSGLLVVLARERLGTDSAGFGFLLGAIGVGAVAGTLLLARHIRPGVRGWLFGPLAGRGLVDLGLATTTSPALAGGLLAVYGAGTSTGTIAFQSTLQTETDAERRGRVFAFFDILWGSGRLVSLGIGGVLADVLGVRAVYYAGGVVLVLAALTGFRSPLLRTTARGRGRGDPAAPAAPPEPLG